MIAASLRVKLRSKRHYLAFLSKTFKVIKELEGEESFHGAKTLLDRNATFWVVSLWSDPVAMRKWAIEGTHARAMPLVARWCDEAGAVAWEVDSDIPSWETCHRMLMENGKPSRLRDPNDNHRAWRIDPPKQESKYNVSSVPPSRRTPPGIGKLLSVTTERQKDLSLTMWISVRLGGCTKEEVLKAFFDLDFYDPSTPLLWAMTCTQQKHTIGQDFKIEGFRPKELFWLPAIGNKFSLFRKKDRIHGEMQGALWQVVWFSNLHESSGGVTLHETFKIKGCPTPKGDEQGILKRILCACSRLVTSIPIVDGLARRFTSRICSFFHELHAPYHKTIPARIRKIQQFEDSARSK